MFGAKVFVMLAKKNKSDSEKISFETPIHQIIILAVPLVTGFIETAGKTPSFRDDIHSVTERLDNNRRNDIHLDG